MNDTEKYYYKQKRRGTTRVWCGTLEDLFKLIRPKPVWVRKIDKIKIADILIDKIRNAAILIGIVPKW